MAQIMMLPPSPFLVHSLFAIGGWLLRGGVISRDCFLTIAGKASMVMSRGREYGTQYLFDGRTDGLLPLESL